MLRQSVLLILEIFWIKLKNDKYLIELYDKTYS